MQPYYAAMPTRNEPCEGASALSSMADALGFRYFWATAELPDKALAFRPPGGGMDLGGLMRHLRDLSWKIMGTVTGETPDRSDADLAAMRDSTLEWIKMASDALARMDASALAGIRITSSGGDEGDVWTLIYGPMADFLTHVGQVNSWRRMAGSPAPAVQHFRGLPPSGDSPAQAAPAEPFKAVDMDLSESAFHDVALTGATFDDVSLAGAKFTNVTFAGATLHDVDLSNVNITDANLDGLRIDGELWDATGADSSGDSQNA